MKRVILTSLGWLVAIMLLGWVLLVIELEVNFFNWRPEMSPKLIGGVAGLLLIVAGLRQLARVSTPRAAGIVPLIACVAALVCSVQAAKPEPLTTGWLARTAPSPRWYRYGRILVCGLPGVFLASAISRQRSRQG